jgi:putative membrane protein
MPIIKEIKELQMINLDYMFETGFFGTRAPIFMDVVTLIVALLPFLVAGAIYFAKNQKYKLHAISQVIIFAFSTIVVVYFEIGVRMVGGFESFMQESGVSYNYAFIVLVFHIVISVITLILWAKTIFTAKKQVKQNKHKSSGMMTFVGIVMTSLTGIWVYFLMFVY